MECLLIAFCRTFSGALVNGTANICTVSIQLAFFVIWSSTFTGTLPSRHNHCWLLTHLSTLQIGLLSLVETLCLAISCSSFCIHFVIVVISELTWCNSVHEKTTSRLICYPFITSHFDPSSPLPGVVPRMGKKRGSNGSYNGAENGRGRNVLRAFALPCVIYIHIRSCDTKNQVSSHCA